MNNLYGRDLKNAITALEFMIIDYEEEAIKQNAPDSLWARVDELSASLNNLKLLKAIYG